MTDFNLLICEWYRRNKRDLPWRETKNPYFIWLSEVILQQTRVNQGLNYYLKFVKNYPTVKDLAFANEQDVLNDWQGLGYYSRARNLQKSAQIVVDKFNAEFPTSYDDILSLKGVGEYTAAAITSFAYNLPYAVLDGNVYRVLSRFFDISIPIDTNVGKKVFSKLAQDLLLKENPSEYNQAIMEFGAIQCTPKNPTCECCVLQNQCLAFQNKTIINRPIKLGKTKVRKRFLNYLIFVSNGKILIQKRVEEDIWKHLFEFPLLETESEQNEPEFELILKNKYGISPTLLIYGKKHVLSHQHLFSNYWIFKCENFDFFEKSKNCFEIELKNIQDFPVPRLIDRFLEENYEKIVNVEYL